MADNPSKKNIFLAGEGTGYPYEMEAFFDSNPINPVVNTEGAEGEGGDAGGITLSVEQLSAYLQAAFNQERRQRIDGQRKFGVCPLSEDPNSLLGKKNSPSCGLLESPQSHPLLSKTQQFSGMADELTPIPEKNSEASKQFPEKRLENQHRLQKNLGLGASKSVKLARY